ncbi:MAG: hypothetical protein AVDCRST_MAG77-3648 [uncultured Chloroflexi bacterium]|uniref:Uncharacterized protein n=1 Tax=uncultured Chloroflexota bacterium TaxID=166587 RepID=A0A6J4JHB3_9CHLR|nr:MAG: hypothetical protein AVDCRST_MAG77-3648 [uncultured Chloroflexota bacterium]
MTGDDADYACQGEATHHTTGAGGTGHTPLLTFKGMPAPFVDGTIAYRAAPELLPECGSPGGAPWLAGQLRETYERVVPPVWRLLADGLDVSAGSTSDRRPADGGDGRDAAGPAYAGEAALAQLPGAIARLADRTSPDDQRALLYALGAEVHVEPGPIEAVCGCPHCASARVRQRRQSRMWSGPPLRAAFMLVLGWHLEIVLKAPTPYDHRHGLPHLLCEHGESEHASGGVVGIDQMDFQSADGPSGCRRAGRRGGPRRAVSRARAGAFTQGADRGELEQLGLLAGAVREQGSPWDRPGGEQVAAAVWERVERFAGLVDQLLDSAWPLLKGGLVPPDADSGVYDAVQIGLRLEGVAIHLAHVVVGDDVQRAYLEVTGGIRSAEAALADGFRCVVCEQAAGGRGPQWATPVWLHHLFGHCLPDLVLLALARQDPIDLRRGMPRLVLHPRDAYFGVLPVGVWPARVPSPRRHGHGRGWDGAPRRRRREGACLG